VIRGGAREAVEPGGELRLREVEAADAERLYRWRMEPTARAMFRNADLVSFPAHRAYLEAYLQPACRDRWFVIEARGEPIGAIALYDFSADGTEAEWGRFVIAPERRGAGWGRRALALLIAHARDLGVRRLRCEVLDGNPAGRLYGKAGFAADGTYEHGGRRLHRLVAHLDPPAAGGRP
jgi:RimJ/RimL family protein N-acetyltransferase